MRFTINLATRTYLDHQRVNRFILATLVIALSMLAWNVSRLSSNLGELNRVKSEITAFEGRLNSRPAGVPEKDFNRLLSGIRFYNDIIERKAFNWSRLLEELENATPDGISLMTVAPDKKTGGISIEGRAKSFAQVRAYLEKLEDSGAFTDILLQSHKDLLFGEKNRGVQFALSCRLVMR